MIPFTNRLVRKVLFSIYSAVKFKSRETGLITLLSAPRYPSAFFPLDRWLLESRVRLSQGILLENKSYHRILDLLRSPKYDWDWRSHWTFSPSIWVETKRKRYHLWRFDHSWFYLQPDDLLVKSTHGEYHFSLKTMLLITRRANTCSVSIARDSVKPDILFIKMTTTEGTISLW
jgi:hypothetical protein